jgi:protease PrsW
MEPLILSTLAVGPGTGLAVYIYYADKWEPEPKKLLIQCFILGSLACIPAILYEVIFQEIFSFEGLLDDPRQFTFLAIMFFSFFGVALPEEVCKFLFLTKFIYHNHEFNEPMDGIVYGGMIGCGFATLENIGYVVEGGYGVGIARMFIAVPSHACDGIILGYFMAKGKFSPNPKNYLTKGLLLVMVLHGTYDFGIFYGEDWSNLVFTIPTYFLGLYFALKAKGKMKYHSMAVELSSKEYFIVKDGEKYGLLRLKDARNMLANELLQLDDELIDKESGEKNTIKDIMYNTLWKDTAFKKTTKKHIENDLEKGEGASFPLSNGTKVFCGNCGQSNPRGNNFCAQCGKPLVL